jgi:hypothetical protein
VVSRSLSRSSVYSAFGCVLICRLHRSYCRAHREGRRCDSHVHFTCQQHLKSPTEKYRLVRRWQLGQRQLLDSRPVKTCWGRPDFEGVWLITLEEMVGLLFFCWASSDETPAIVHLYVRPGAAAASVVFRSCLRSRVVVCYPLSHGS